jgi:hypothetical protein
MRTHKYFLLLWFYSIAVFSNESNCLSLPLGITETAYQNGKKIIAVAKTNTIVSNDKHSNETAIHEAEILAKSLLIKHLGNKADKLSGAYQVNSCSTTDFTYVSVAIDSNTQALSNNIKSNLTDSFIKNPTPKLKEK